MAEELETSIKVEWIETDETPFDPKKTTEIFAVLEPLEAGQATFYTPTYTDFYKSYVLPPYIDYKKLPEFEAVPSELIINIETTAVLPWESRIVCIGVLDPNALAPEATNFIRESEEETLNEFLVWFETQNYTTLAGYNVSFDYRFIFAVCQKYRKTARKFMAAGLRDLMQVQKQVKEAFVFGYNKPGTLEQWSTYLFGTKPYASQRQVLKWHEEKNVDEIVNFNSDKLAKAYFLWVVDKIVEGTIPGAEVLARPSTPGTETPQGTLPAGQEAGEEKIKVQCPNCRQLQDMPKTARVINCFVCGEPIAHP